MYTVGSATAVLDLVPADTATGGGVINFQNAGTTALYTSTPGGPAFTILNRIVPADATRPIAFNGSVVSQLQNAAGAAARGGTIWFYSPGGIVVGDGAVFDVGNLLLTTGDPTGGTGTIGSTTGFGLNSTADGGGIVNILSGATINAVNPGSYVALVAPIVFQRGTVNINGSAAYVAAEQATLTFNQGLFDINVTVGSSAAGGFPLQHLGTTRFQNVATPSRAYLVSVPKNDAITLIVGGTADIGFDVATTVGVENGLVVLGSGTAVLDASSSFGVQLLRSPTGSGAADLSFEGGGTFNAKVVGRARDQASLIVGASTSFGSDVTLTGGTLAQAGGDGAGNVLTVRGNLSLDANGPGVNSSAAFVAGEAFLRPLNGGSVSVGGNVLVDASIHSLSLVAGATGTGTGGTASIDARGGDISIGGSASATASGFSATQATGGNASIFVGVGRTLAIGGTAIVSAPGFDFEDSPIIGTTSGTNTTGGTARVSVDGTLRIGTGLTASATARGGDKITTTAGNGGNATGGTASVSTSSGGIITATGISVNAGATGGKTVGDGTGGAATGGAASLSSAGTITAGSLFVSSRATGGGRTAGAGDAGAAVAGTTLAQATGAGTLTITGNARVESIGIGGAVSGTGAGSGGAGAGGDASIGVTGGARINLGSADIGAGGGGGAGAGAGAGGAGTGGTTALLATAGGSATIAGATTLAAAGTGGDGGTIAGAGGRGDAGGSPANVDGGAYLQAIGGSILLGTTTTLTAGGRGGLGYGGAAGGEGTGGFASLLARNGAVDTRGGTLSALANGDGGAGADNGSAGGAGTGGQVIVFGGTTATAAAAVGQVRLAASDLLAIGSGGRGADGAAGRAGGAGGAGNGGRADMYAQAGNGILVAPDTSIVADGRGGIGGAGGAINAVGVSGTGGAGGAGTGGYGNSGTVSLPNSTFTNGRALLGDLFVTASGVGGAGGGAVTSAQGGAGGDGIGGGYAILSRGSPVTADTINMIAIGSGGQSQSGAGGRGEGGDLGLVVTNRFEGSPRGSFVAQTFITDTSGGADPGTPTIAGTSEIMLSNGDASIGTVRFATAGDTPATGRLTNLNVAGGTLTIPTLTATAVGDIGLYTSAAGVIAIGDATLNATGTLRFGDGTTPSNVPGDIDIDTLFATLGGDLIVERDTEFAGDLFLQVGGRIQAQTITAGGNVSVGSGRGTVVGNVLAGGGLELSSSADVTSGNIQSVSGAVEVIADGNAAIGNVSAGDKIEVFAGGSLTAGDLILSPTPQGLANGDDGEVVVAANGDIRLGNVTGVDIDIDGTDLGNGPYGDIATGTLTGEYIELLGGRNVTVAGVTTAELFSGGVGDENIYAAQIGAVGNLTIGTIDALGLVALASAGGSVSTGAITTPSSIVALAANNVSFTSARSGRGATNSVFVANASMLETTPALAAVLGDNEADQLDPAILTTLTPVRIGGVFTTAGPIVTGNLLAAAQGGVALGAIDASTRIALDSGAGITLGDVTTPANLDLASDGAISAGTITAASVGLTSDAGGITTGAITAPDELVLLAPSRAGDISTGLLTSANEINVTGGGSVRVGGATLTSAVEDTGPFGVGIIAGTDLTIGAVDSARGIGLLARGGSITAGGLNARTGDIAMLASGSVGTGAIATGTGGTVFIGNASQFRADFDVGDDEFDPGPILNAAPVRIGGAITLAGPVTTGTFRAAATGAIGAQTIDAAAVLFVDTGGGATLGAITAGQTAYVGGTGAIAIAGAAVAQGRLTVDTAGNIAIGTTRTGTDALLIATGGRIDASGPIAAGGSIALLADSGIATGALSGGRGDGAFVYLAGAGNRARIGADGVFPASFATDTTSTLLAGPLSVGGAISGGVVRSSVDGASRFDGAIDGAQRVRLFSRGLAINGSVAAPAIELLSTDIALARGITVGGTATRTIALGTLSTAAPAMLGGGGGDAAGGYVLDATELAQLRAASISFGQGTRYGSGDQPVVVRDLTLLGADAGQAANLTAADGAFTIEALNDIQVLGNVRLNNATAGNALVFNAAGAFDLVTDTGSVGVFGTGDALGGRLAITASEIASADSRLFALADATDFDEADAADVIAAIGAPAARTRAEGYIQANRLELSARDSIVIQNSGTGALAGGFTAGSGGLRITGLNGNGDGVAAGERRGADRLWPRAGRWRRVHHQCRYAWRDQLCQRHRAGRSAGRLRRFLRGERGAPCSRRWRAAPSSRPLPALSRR